jgi:catechol 2,3-dioxygenase-like lactoylglutathione lyase family enzyme
MYAIRMYIRMRIAYICSWRIGMPIVLNHLIVPAGDRLAAASFLADLLGLPAPGQAGPFAAVRVNEDLTLDFDDRHGVRAGHYAFLIDEGTFDAVLARLHAAPEIPYGAGPGHGWNRGVDDLADGRRVYVRDPDGHSYELFTAVP